MQLPYPLPEDSLTGFDKVERNEYGLPAKQGLYVRPAPNRRTMY
jgi:hypothetical protein